MSMIQQLAALCMLAARRETLKKLVLTAPLQPEITRAAGRLCTVGGKVVLQMELLHADNKAKHRNLPLDEQGEQALTAILADFGRANLLTTVGDCEYRTKKGGDAVLLGGEKLQRRLLREEQAQSVAVIGNNKVKKRILRGDEPFLRLLGVSDEQGRVYDKKQAKFRQINRFLELVGDTLSNLPREGELAIADLCCGKSYLSFAVYHYFTHVQGREVRMHGVDLKPDVVEHCNAVAARLGFSGLHFTCGDVARFEAQGDLDLVVSLHACDTATDLVLERALHHRARVILSTPCCHHELNHTLNCQALGFIAEHSMLRQKLCDAATDALRLKLLEANGYEVAALELIDPDDTPKNVMLRALRRADAGTRTPRELRAMEEYRAARAFLLGE